MQHACPSLEIGELQSTVVVTDSRSWRRRGLVSNQVAGRGRAERGFRQGLSLQGATWGEVIVASESSFWKPAGGYIPVLGVRACRWPRARVPLKVTSQPDWVRSQFSTSDWSHWEVSVGGEEGVGRGMKGVGLGEAQGYIETRIVGQGLASWALGLSCGDKPEKCFLLERTTRSLHREGTRVSCRGSVGSYRKEQAASGAQRQACQTDLWSKSPAEAEVRRGRSPQEKPTSIKIISCIQASHLLRAGVTLE